MAQEKWVSWGVQLNDESYEGSAGIVLKKGPWTSTEDDILVDYVKKHGEMGNGCEIKEVNHALD